MKKTEHYSLSQVIKVNTNNNDKVNTNDNGNSRYTWRKVSFRDIMENIPPKTSPQSNNENKSGES